ncbi:MAG TPA: hypothetical protein VHW44_29840 [Pseudonocardiaceae bacterium]|jgi:hypothetical protein|nr:hypothetical protein [Pseudonocardiaceae bacterium]
MSGHDEETVANPDRTQIDDEDQSGTALSGRDEGGRPPDPDRHDPHPRDPHDQPWPAVAEEVKQAVEDADGPLD